MGQKHGEQQRPYHVVKNPKIHQLLPTKIHEHPMVRQSQK
jgi:hypothetical protein